MHELIELAIAEDVGSGDLTAAAVLPTDAAARARILQKQEGAIAGLDVAGAVFRRMDPELRFRSHVAEGAWGEPGRLVAEVAGPARPLISGERVALNFLGRLSGVATLAARFVRAVEGTGATILDTRKTTPGLRALEKRAVAAGGAANHRVGLYDALMVKENHAALGGGIGAATHAALAAAQRHGVPVIVECASLEEVDAALEEVDAALEAGAPRLLLDNFSRAELREAVSRARGRAETEASGGVTLDNVRAIAETGVDYISVGALTHSAPALDLSMTVEPL